MCYGHVDAKVLEREARDRMSAVVVETTGDDKPAPLPPELMGGLRGIWARLFHWVRLRPL